MKHEDFIKILGLRTILHDSTMFNNINQYSGKPVAFFLIKIVASPTDNVRYEKIPDDFGKNSCF
jgi:hypothetical protein